MTGKQPARPDPTAQAAIRQSLVWVAGAIAGLLVCLLLLPSGIGQLGALVVGIVTIIKIRSIWRQGSR